jgi:hypothetical protein
MLASVIHKRTPISYGPVVLAGSTAGTSGSTDGTTTAARFNNPTWIVADGIGSYYISDTSNHTIRKMTSAGVVTTVFGTAGVAGSDLSHLNSPRGIALDFAKNLYVADYSNSRILFISNGSTTGSNYGTLSNVIQVAVDSNGSNLLAMTNVASKNIYQFRNGALDGLLNTSVTYNGTTYNLIGGSIAYSPAGSFYWAPIPNQVQNQQGMSRLGTLQAPTIITTAVGGVNAYGYSGHNGEALASVTSSAGITVGMPFTFSGFTTGSYASYNGYNGTVLAVNQSAANNFTFKYVPYLTYPTAKPNTDASISNSVSNSGSSYSNIISIGWDSNTVFQGPGSFAPADRLRLNFYFSDSNSVFPSISKTFGGTALSGTTTLAGFSNSFSVYNGAYTTSTVSSMSVQDVGYTTATTIMMGFTMGITSGASVTQQYTSLQFGMYRTSLAGYTLRGPGVPDGCLIISDSYSGSDNFGTITINIALVTTGSGYFVTDWPFSASRAVTIDFGSNVIPSAGGSGATFTAKVINNSSNGVTINGAPYGYIVNNIQFPAANISAFYASAQYGGGIQKYNLVGDVGTSAESNSATGNPLSFCVANYPTSELVTFVPTGSSNNIVIYSKSY